VPNGELRGIDKRGLDIWWRILAGGRPPSFNSLRAPISANEPQNVPKPQKLA